MTDENIAGSAVESATSAPPRILRRSTQDRVIAGVCGGIGRYLGVDPVVLRLAWVVLTLAFGVGIVLYLIAWVVIPAQAPGEEVVAAPRTAAAPMIVGVVLVALGGLILMRDLFPWFEEYMWPLALIALGLGLMVVRR